MLDQVIEQITAQAANAAPLGGILKFVIDGQPILINGSGDSNVVSTEDGEANCTITTSAETLRKVTSGETNPMMAVMGGDIRIDGDMGLAMKLQSLLG
ncbi:MAG: SCP2 sterol-binding domain-containing protein [Bacteroidota bacterium]